MRQLFEVGADRLWVDDSGAGGDPLVLLHPGIADLRCWDMVWGPLTESYRAVRFDRRGFGGSPAPTERFSWSADLGAVLDHLGLGSVHLVGNSNGGETAISFALQHPERVRSLVLLAPGIGGYEWPPTPELDARWQALTDAGDADGLVELMLELWCAAGHEPFVRELVEVGVAADAAESGLRDAEPDQWDRLGELSMPTVIVVGDRDLADLVAMNAAAAQRIPGCRLITAAGVDHLPQLRVPDLVVQTIRDTCR